MIGIGNKPIITEFGTRISTSLKPLVDTSTGKAIEGRYVKVKEILKPNGNKITSYYWNPSKSKPDQIKFETPQYNISVYPEGDGGKLWRGKILDNNVSINETPNGSCTAKVHGYSVYDSTAQTLRDFLKPHKKVSEQEVRYVIRAEGDAAAWQDYCAKYRRF